MHTVLVGLQGNAEILNGVKRLLPLFVLVIVHFYTIPLNAADVTLQNDTVTNTRTITSPDGSITAGQGYIINSPGNVTFKGYTEINLKSGFTTSPGSSFEACLIGTEYDSSVRYYTVTGTATLNGSGVANVPIYLSGSNTYGRWVSRSALTDGQGAFTITVPEGTYDLREFSDSYVFRLGEISSIQVSGANVAVNAEATALTQTDTHFTYYHHDVLGNTVALTNDNGGVIMRSVYYPFGDQYSTEGVGERYLFTGKERDASGLDYFGARYYEPSLGRFSGIDPHEGVIDNPQGWNRYIYCFNNPFKYIDPDGMDPHQHDTGPDHVARLDKNEREAKQEKLRLSFSDPSLIEYLRGPDYISLNLNVAYLNKVTGNWIGWSGLVSFDRYGNWDWSISGMNIGKSRNIVSFCGTLNWMNKKNKPSEEELNIFLSGNGFNASWGHWVGVTESWSPGKGTASGFGIVTPQLGGSYNYSIRGKGKTGITW
jgi:RHS repeat-associated protein